MDRALSSYQSGSDVDFRRGEIARTTHLKGLILAQIGNLRDAEDCRRSAIAMAQVVKPSTKNVSDDEAFFDSLVSLWAR